VRHPQRDAVLLFFSEGQNTRLELRNEPWQNNAPLWSYFCKAMGAGAEAIFHPEGHILLVKASDAGAGGGDLSVIDPDHGFILYSVDTVGMHLSGDGKQVVAEGGESSSGLILPLLQNDSSVPSWLADFAEAIGGIQIAEDGGLVRLTTPQRWTRLRSSLAAASAANDPWSDFLSKFFSLDIKNYEAPVKGYTGWPISQMNPDDKTQTARQEEAAAYIREAKETLAEKKEPMSDDDSAQEEWTEFKHYAEAEAYFNGDNREKNPQLAAKHFRIAAEKGYAKAQHKLGVCYAIGKGVEQNEELAVAWYQKAAAQGFAEAEYNLGVRYVLGKGVDKDPVKGRELYRRAAENGYEPAVNALKKFNN
jgi:hypothetical protein